MPAKRSSPGLVGSPPSEITVVLTFGSYEIGTNPLFDDRTEDRILHDPLIRSQLSKQKPDRVYGLQATKNFDQLLSKTASGSLGAIDGTSVGEIVRSSPFKEGTEPLLFPFLILEAKSESSSNGFGDIQIQTAFPIFALLKLQEDLQAQATESESGVAPLVWFFANRGDAWRIYGCFVSNSETSRYVRVRLFPLRLWSDPDKLILIQNVVQLWDGSIMSKDSALQLLLIVDYIFDWARDIYRPSILRQLKSLSNGEAHDQISLANNSDIMSMRGQISDWIQPPPSAVGSDFDAESANPSVVLDHQNPLPIQIPNTKLGILRSASLVNSQVVGLYITEHNVRTFLELAAGASQNTSRSEKAAREVVSFLTRWEELIVLDGDDIDKIDMTWTKKPRVIDETSISSSMEKFYFLAEFATFVDTSWNIVRQLTYLAVSKAAFEILVRYADYKIKHPGIGEISQLGRPCSPEVLIDSLNCLKSSSIDQVFMMALSCILVSLYSIPERNRLDYVPQTEAFGFGKLRRPRLHKFVQKFHQVVPRKTRTDDRIRKPKGLSWNDQSLFASSERRKRALQAGHQLDSMPEHGLGPKDQSFIRVSEEKVHVSDKEGHETALCERCRRFRFCGGRDPHHMTPSSEHVFSAYGMSLVVACNRADRLEINYDICLFASSIPPEISDNTALSVVVADLFQSGSIYHTIQHPVKAHFQDNILWRDQLWNLPRPYRPSTAKQHSRISNWHEELCGLHLVVSRKAARNDDDDDDDDDDDQKEEGRVEDWNGLQLLLHFLGDGQSYSQAHLSVEVAQAQGKSRRDLYRKLDKDEKQMRANAGVEVHHRSDRGPNWLPSKLSTKGDSDEPNCEFRWDR
jgi:hypothetical protein